MKKWMILLLLAALLLTGCVPAEPQAEATEPPTQAPTAEPTQPPTEPSTEPPTDPPTEPPTEPTEPAMPERYYNPRYRAEKQGDMLGANWTRRDLEREKWSKDSYRPITEGKAAELSAEPILHYETSRNNLFYETENHEVFQTDYTGSYHKLIYTSQSEIQELNYWAKCLYILETDQVVRVDLETLETMTAKNPVQCKCLYIGEDGMVIYYIDEGNAWLLNMYTGESKFLDTPAKMDDYLRLGWGISSIPPSKEVIAMYKAFLEAGKTDYPAAVAQYCHFEDDDYREKVLQSPKAFILDYEFVRWEKISEELWVAWTIISDAQFPEAFETAHFVGLINGEFRVMLRAEQVPEALAEWIYLDPFVLMGEGADA